jgi:hypothetical protein
MVAVTGVAAIEIDGCSTVTVAVSVSWGIA